jgi:hypothetical protein
VWQAKQALAALSCTTRFFLSPPFVTNDRFERSSQLTLRTNPANNQVVILRPGKTQRDIGFPPRQIEALDTCYQLDTQHRVAIQQFRQAWPNDQLRLAGLATRRKNQALAPA